jgi:hypothetical protein
MSDAELSFDPTAAPRPVALATSAVVAVGVLALGLTASSLAPLLASASGALLSVALRSMGRDALSLRTYLRGVATLLASAGAGTVGMIAALSSPAPSVGVGLAAVLWLATFAGVGTGRDTLSSTALSRGWTAAGVALIGLGLVFPLGFAAVAVLASVDWLLGLHAPRPTLGTLLVISGASCLLTGYVLRSTPNDVDARRPINRQLRSRAADLVMIGSWLVGGGVVAGILGVMLGGYDLLLSVAPFVWAALALVTSSALVRAAPVGLATLAVVAWIGRHGVAWAWNDDGLHVGRAGALLSPFVALGALLVTVVAAAVLSALPVFVGPAGTTLLGDPETVMAGFFLALLGTATVLFMFSSTMPDDAESTPPALRLCMLGLLAGAAIVASSGPSVVAPMVAVAAASVVWDIGRVGGVMGVELGDRADVRRGALVRIGGSVAVGALATVAGVALATVAARVGHLFAGPVVLALGVAVALVVTLSWYARRRGTA